MVEANNIEAKMYSKNICLGTLDLKVGDYSMGGLWGIFSPNAYYIEHLQQEIQVYNEEQDRDYKQLYAYEFTVVLNDDYILEPAGGIEILDFQEMFGEAIEVSIGGVACDIIDKYLDSRRFQ